MKTHSLILGLASLFIFANCSQQDRKEEASSKTATTEKELAPREAEKPETEEAKASDEAGNSNNQQNILAKKKMADTTLLTPKLNLESQKGRKFIRTADVKGKVKDVMKTTMKIEDVTSEFKGFITSTDLKSVISYTENPAISADSLLEIKHYIVENHLTIRVPNEKMDSLMRKLGFLFDFVDYRVMKAEDVSLQILSNEMQQKRFNTFENRYTNAIDSKGRKLDETAGAEENLLNRQLQSDQSKIHKLNLEDQIAYSTIQLHLYQRETVTREVYANYRNIESYRPSLWSRIGDALRDGWRVVEHLIVFLFQLWWFWILAVSAWLGYQYFIKKKA